MKRHERLSAFWASMNKSGPIPDQSNPHYVGLDSCWEWTKAKSKDGYGRVCMNYKMTPAHRAAFMLSNGSLSTEKPLVLHRCDNRLCCNPKHLFAGSHADNMADRSERGRSSGPKGIEQHDCKLTEKEVLEIRRIRKTSGYSYAKIAGIFNVSVSHIGSIIRGELWKNLLQ